MQIFYNKNNLVKKLVVVIGEDDSGIFFRDNENQFKSILLGKCGLVFSNGIEISLENLAAEGRFPIYEGDEITIKFCGENT